MSETGDSVPPSKLQTPTFTTNPRDLIKFNPTAFVAVNNGGSPTVQTQTLSTQLSLRLQALNASLGLDELQVSVQGTWDAAVFPMPGATALADLTLQLELVAGGVTKNIAVTVNKNLVDKTWAGALTITQQFLRDNGFIVPATGITDLLVNTTQTVSATAAYGNASSAITYLDVSASAVPEPGSGTLFLLGAALWGLNRIRQNRKS